MAADRNIIRPVAEPPLHDEPIWHALRPEVRSAGLRWHDLKSLAERQQLRSDDYVWHPTWESWRLAKDVPGLVHETGTKGASSERQSPPPRSLKDRARHEFYSYIIITIYIWMILTLLRLHEDLLSETYHVAFHAQARAAVTALILGKVVLIAEGLRLGHFLGAKFPAMSVLIRSALFAAAILAFHACEEAASALWNGRSLASAAAEITGETLRRSGLLALTMTISLIPYFLIKEIEKRSGESNLILIAFGLKR